MSDEPETWSLEGFLNHFQAIHQQMPDRRFCWIIGAGASQSSGIPTGGKLVEWWLQDLYARECLDRTTPIKDWSEKNLGIKGFEYSRSGEWYPDIYRRRFQADPDEGYAYLEHVMTGNRKTRGAFGVDDAKPQKIIEPGPGYSILAKILEKTPHRAVITTNFDNLVADALQVFTNTYPLVCGHEALASFVRVAMRRPIVCKIHRDLLLAPLNEPRQLRLLHESWSATIRHLVEACTPIVIGYGGNDGSLMERLASLDRSSINGRLIWCYFRGSDGKSEPSQRVKDLVRDLNGVLVPVPDFDRLMILLGSRIGIEPLQDDLAKRLTGRISRYQREVREIKTDDLPEIKPALRKTFESAGWWWWQLKVDEKKDPAEKEATYREALSHCPKSSELIGNFANFLTDERKNYDEAEFQYRRATSLDPTYASNLGNFATFLAGVRKDYAAAEPLFRKAIELDPNDANHAGNLALFLTEVRKDHDAAEQMFRKMYELGSDHAGHIGNFASFLTNVRKDHDTAERLYREALELDPDHTDHCSNFASFLMNVRNDCEAAEKLYRKVLERVPHDGNSWANLVQLSLIQNRLDDTDDLIDRALRIVGSEASQTAGEVFLYQAVICAIRGDNFSSPVELLLALLKQGFDRLPWTFEPLFEAVKSRISPKNFDILQAYGEAILDERAAECLRESVEAIERKYSVAPRRRSKRSSRLRKPDPTE